MLVTRAVAVPLQAARIIGYRRVALLATGAAIGALVTPVAGAELRAKIIAEYKRRRAGTEPSVEQRVRDHLAKSPRTWHLPQPEVVAVAIGDTAGWEIILAGEVPEETARVDLEQATRSVAGVQSVDNRLRVAANKS